KDLPIRNTAAAVQRELSLLIVDAIGAVLPANRLNSGNPLVLAVAKIEGRAIRIRVITEHLDGVPLRISRDDRVRVRRALEAARVGRDAERVVDWDIRG